MSDGILKRWLRKFVVRTFFSYMGLIALVFLLIYLFSQAPIRNFYLGKLKTHLKQVGQTFKPKAVELYDAGKIAELDHLVKETGSKIDIRLTVIRPDGIVIADSLNDPAQMENHGDRPEILKAMKGSTGDSTRFSTTMGEQMLYLALPVVRQGETRLVLRLSLYLKEIRQLMNELKWKFATVLLLLFVLAFTMAWFFSRSISKPVQAVMSAMRQFASGNFDTRVYLKQRDELGEMADSFNKMAEQQKKLFDKLTNHRTQLQTIISSMREALMVIDSDGKILLCNESFEYIAGKKEAKGCTYWESLRIPDFEEHVRKAFRGELKSYQKIELDNRTYLVGFNLMEKEEKLVVIFRDITDFQQLETMKKEFVVNLTHELKTPLTAIKGFMETLEEEENIKHQEYVDIIKRHTERMTQIVSDLLVLSELEKMQENKENIRFEPVDLEELITHIVKLYKGKMNGKDLEMIVNIPGNLPRVTAERFKLEQLFINLLDNAVKYADLEKGEISISVTGPVKAEDGKEDYVDIRVENNGPPIPEKSLPRIFERFYVVDKSRSRTMGGTGLGLSIVKHVVLLHNGEISVTSTKEKTTFVILLPLKQ